MLARESDPSVRRRISSESRRMASLATPLYMASTEVTVGQFRRFVDATGYVTQVERGRRPAYGLRNGTWVQDVGYSWRNLGSQPLTDDHPVCNVTYSDAVAFCDWLTATSNSPRGSGCPRRPSGSTPVAPAAVAPGRSGRPRRCWRPTPGAGPTRARRTTWFGPWQRRSPNAFGLYDMLGNVEELCVARRHVADVTPGPGAQGRQHCRRPAPRPPAARNPTHPAAPEGGFRVVMEQAAFVRRG